MDKTLLKGLVLLELLATAKPAPRAIEAIAALAGLTRSNAHRTLSTLMHAGLVERERESGEYRVTMKILAVGLAARGLRTLPQIAPCFMANLASTSGETVHLSTLHGIEVRYLDKIESRQPVRAYSEIGGRAPAHAVATGKALLAAQDAAWLARLPAVLEGYTATTLTSADALRAALAEVTLDGYAVNRGEWREGVGGVAAVIRDAAGTAVAAIGVSGPLDRLTSARMTALAPLVMQSARELSHTLASIERLATTAPTAADPPRRPTAGRRRLAPTA
jgi:DNA-binding IclR family transcriptional regulator